MRTRVHALIAGLITALMAAAPLAASQLDPSLFAAMRWRQIGPFRAGRVSAVAGVIGQPGTYYMGSPSGGLWKSTDAGAVWRPIFDQTHSASIGAIAVAPSNPEIVYAGHGRFWRRGHCVRSGVSRRRDVAIGRRREHLASCGPRRYGTYREDTHRPEEPRHCACCGARRDIRTRFASWRLFDRGWRQNLDQDALPGRYYRAPSIWCLTNRSPAWFMVPSGIITCPRHQSRPRVT